MKKLSIALITLLVTSSAWAYQIAIPLTDRSKSSVQRGFQRGAETLLLRLTANDQAAQSLTANSKQVRNWVDEYATTQNPGDPEHPWQLQATYSDRGIQQLLRNNHLPHWKKPPAPLNLVIKTTEDTPLTDDDPRWQSLRDAAQARGYSFTRLEQTPEQLPSNLLIAVLADQTINWSWYHDGQWRQWQQPLNEQWVNLAADSIGQTLLESQPQQVTSDLTPVHLVINGVQDFRDYTDVIQRLRKLHGIRSLTDDGIHGNQLSLTLITNGSVSDIKQALDTIQQLREQLGDSTGSDTDLSYSWRNQPTPTPDLQYQDSNDIVSAVDTSLTQDN
jgi:hypothetical protein